MGFGFVNGGLALETSDLGRVSHFGMRDFFCFFLYSLRMGFFSAVGLGLGWRTMGSVFGFGAYSGFDSSVLGRALSSTE